MLKKSEIVPLPKNLHKFPEISVKVLWPTLKKDKMVT